MKKILLGTSAIIAAAAIATPAAAQLDLAFSGFIEWNAGFGSENTGHEVVAAEDADRIHDFSTDADFVLDVSGLADNGITYGGRLEFDPTGGAFVTDETWIFFSGGFGTITLGDDDMSHDDFGVTPPTAGTGIVDGSTFDFLTEENAGPNFGATSTQSTKIKWSSDGIAALDNAGLTVGFSYQPDGTSTMGAEDFQDDAAATAGLVTTADTQNNFSFGLNYSTTFGAVTITTGGGAAYWGIDSNPLITDVDNDPLPWSGEWGLRVGFGGFTVGANAVYDLGTHEKDNDYAINTGATYATGPWTFGVGYSFSSADTMTNIQGTTGVAAAGGMTQRATVKDQLTTAHLYGLGVTYDAPMPGVTIAADVAGYSEDGFDDTQGFGAVTRVQLSF